MYYLLSGQLPFPGDTVAECLARRIRGGPVPITDLNPELSPRLVQVLDKLLARRPEDRFQTAAEAALALEALAPVRPTSRWVATRRCSRPAALGPEPAFIWRGGVDRSPPVFRPACEPPRPDIQPLVSRRLILSGRPRVVAVLILVFELIVFGIAFASRVPLCDPEGVRGQLGVSWTLRTIVHLHGHGLEGLYTAGVNRS